MSKHLYALSAVAKRSDHCKWRCPAQNSPRAACQKTRHQKQIRYYPFTFSREEREETFGDQEDRKESKSCQGSSTQKGKNSDHTTLAMKKKLSLLSLMSFYLDSLFSFDLVHQGYYYSFLCCGFL